MQERSVNNPSDEQAIDGIVKQFFAIFTNKENKNLILA